MTATMARHHREGPPQGVWVTRVEIGSGYRLRLQFSHGLVGEVFEPPRDLEFFRVGDQVDSRPPRGQRAPSTPHRPLTLATDRERVMILGRSQQGEHSNV